LSEGALDIAGGDGVLTIGSIASPCSEASSGWADGLNSIALAAASGLLLPAGSWELAGRGFGVCEADSSAYSGRIGNLVSIALVAFAAPSNRLPSGPRPAVSPMVKAATENKNSNANAVT
jgi:hypothetical protein